jgi:hypothetical protein
VKHYLYILLFFFVLIILNGCADYRVSRANKNHSANPKAPVSTKRKESEILLIDMDNLPEQNHQMMNHEMGND